MALLLLLGGLWQTAAAHAGAEIGPYTVILGWVEEPPLVGERNALFLEILEADAPVTGAEASLSLTVLDGGRTFSSNLNPGPDHPGHYTAEIFPTVRGQYEVELTGTLGETTFDHVLEPEEVFSAARLQFPEAQPDTLTLQDEMEATIADLQSQLQTARLLAIGGLLLGVAGVGLLASV